ncbi:MAG: hypothetical protein ACRDQ2_18460 [Gaiellales bacterium]
MQRGNRWMVGVLIIAGLHLSACTDKSAGAAGDHDDDDGPAKVEHLEAENLSRVILTTRAAERLDIKTAPAGEAVVARSPDGTQRKVVPYAAVLYDAQGDTWVYTSPEPQVFVRHRVSVDYIDGDLAVLSEGPPTGTEVVTVGAAELFGAEFEIGH